MADPYWSAMNRRYPGFNAGGYSRPSDSGLREALDAYEKAYPRTKDHEREAAKKWFTELEASVQGMPSAQRRAEVRRAIDDLLR